MSVAPSARGGCGAAKAARRHQAGRVGGGRRRAAVVLLLLALAYAAGLLMFVLGGGGSVDGDGHAGVTVASLRRRRAPAPSPPPPGSVYRSHIVFKRLWPDIRDDAASASTATSASVSTSSPWRRSMVGGLCSCSYRSPWGDLGFSRACCLLLRFDPSTSSGFTMQ